MVEHPQKTRIMIVEDTAVVAKHIEATLQHFGYQVVGTFSLGEKAVQKVTVLLPDLVLMDIRLKGVLDGIEAATQIRQHHNIPIIYLTFGNIQIQF